MEYSEKPAPVKPRIIIHGGAGNITRDNLSHEAYAEYKWSLLSVLGAANDKLQSPGATAIDVATYAVTLLENNPLFNAGHGAVFTRAETHELEASVMVSRGYRKRGVGVMKVRKVKNPILLAKEMLVRGEEDGGGGAGQHCQLEGDTCDELARAWNLEMVDSDYYWTRKRWDEHRRGLGLAHDDDIYKRHRREAGDSHAEKRVGTLEENSTAHQRPDDGSFDDPTWDGKEYLPQGTVGAVVLDSTGTICAATSTGGLTNKLPGRIGDTPTLGAGFWAEEFEATSVDAPTTRPPSLSLNLHPLVTAAIGDCMPNITSYLCSTPQSTQDGRPPVAPRIKRAVGMSGTGNGDSFLRINAVRTAAAMARFMSTSPQYVGRLSLQSAVSSVAGPNGQLQRSAEDRWRKTGEGEGGIIGIDFQEGKGTVVADFNCGGMFRTWIDDNGDGQMAVFRTEK